MYRLINMLGVEESRNAAKINLGRWEWTEKEPRPKWESMSKAAIWANPEWAEVRQSMARPLTLPFQAPDPQQTSNTLYLRPPKAGEEATGPHMHVGLVGAGKGISPKLHALNPSFVCYRPVLWLVLVGSELVFL